MDTPTCTARFIKQRLRDPEQDARMQCSLVDGHYVRHRNEKGDLYWERGLEIDVADLLDEPDPAPGCCAACRGQGGTLSGPCTDCYGTGHAHPNPEDCK